jgi:kynurenine formamidase
LHKAAQSDLVGAPHHYRAMSAGKPARTIDQVPLEWCFAPGVVLDFRHNAAGEFITVTDLEATFQRIEYRLWRSRTRVFARSVSKPVRLCP